MEKKNKILLGVVIIAILILATPSIIYFSEPQINYWNDTYNYQKANGQWETIDYNHNNQKYNGTFITFGCLNKGTLNGKFDLIVRLTNATFIQNDTNNSWMIGAEAKLPITLHSMEEQNTNLYFSINEGANGFVVSLTLEPSQLFMRSIEANWDGQNPIPYTPSTGQHTQNPTDFGPDLYL